MFICSLHDRCPALNIAHIHGLAFQARQIVRDIVVRAQAFQSFEFRVARGNERLQNLIPAVERPVFDVHRDMFFLPVDHLSGIRVSAHRVIHDKGIAGDHRVGPGDGQIGFHEIGQLAAFHLLFRVDRQILNILLGPAFDHHAFEYTGHGQWRLIDQRAHLFIHAPVHPRTDEGHGRRRSKLEPVDIGVDIGEIVFSQFEFREIAFPVTLLQVAQ